MPQLCERRRSSPLDNRFCKKNRRKTALIVTIRSVKAACFFFSFDYYKHKLDCLFSRWLPSAAMLPLVVSRQTSLIVKRNPTHHARKRFPNWKQIIINLMRVAAYNDQSSNQHTSHNKRASHATTYQEPFSFLRGSLL